MPRRAHLNLEKRILTTVGLVVGILAAGVIVSTSGVLAQAWQNPASNIPSVPGDPNVDPPLYAGSTASYGASAQYRSGPLTIGQTAAVTSSALYIFGQSLVTGEVNVGTGDFSSVAASVTAFGAPGDGVYGTSALPDDGTKVGTGVYGVTTVNSGRAVWGNALGVNNGIGAYGLASGNQSYGVYGFNADSAGWAGYFTGAVKIVNISGGPNGMLTSEGSATFSSNVSVLGSTATAASLVLTGTPFDPKTVNARSVQDMASGAVPTPFIQPGIRTLALNSSTSPCKVGGVACPAGGLISAGSTAEWNIGPAPAGSGIFYDKRKVVISYLVQYSHDGYGWSNFSPVGGADRKYEECTLTGQNTLAKFSVTNSLGAPAKFRLLVWYKEYPTGQICNPAQRWRQVTVSQAADQNDTLRIYLDGATNPMASEIFSQTAVEDLRVFYAPTATELDSDVISFSSSVIELFFRAQVTVAGPDSANYRMYYGGSGFGTPAMRNKNNVYLLWDDFTGNSLNATKWTSAGLIKPGGCSSVSQNNELQLNNTTAACFGGAGAATASVYTNTGKYTILYDLNPESGNPPPGPYEFSANDGMYLRNPSAARETTNYYGPTERALYVGHASSCSSGGIYVYNYGDRPPATENNWFCAWANPANPYRIGAFVKTYNEGSWYGFKVRYDADYQLGGGEIPITKKGFVEVYEPASTMRVWGAMQPESYDGIGLTFTLEFHDGYFSGTANGVERIDNFLMRRGKNSYDPLTTLGPEQT